MVNVVLRGRSRLFADAPSQTQGSNSLGSGTSTLAHALNDGFLKLVDVVSGSVVRRRKAMIKATVYLIRMGGLNCVDRCAGAICEICNYVLGDTVRLFLR